jgi:hypothetical protein
MKYRGANTISFPVVLRPLLACLVTWSLAAHAGAVRIGNTTIELPDGWMPISMGDITVLSPPGASGKYMIAATPDGPVPNTEADQERWFASLRSQAIKTMKPVDISLNIPDASPGKVRWVSGVADNKWIVVVLVHFRGDRGRGVFLMGANEQVFQANTAMFEPIWTKILLDLKPTGAGDNAPGGPDQPGERAQPVTPQPLSAPQEGTVLCTAEGSVTSCGRGSCIAHTVTGTAVGRQESASQMAKVNCDDNGTRQMLTYSISSDSASWSRLCAVVHCR